MASPDSKSLVARILGKRAPKTVNTSLQTKTGAVQTESRINLPPLMLAARKDPYFVRVLIKFAVLAVAYAVVTFRLFSPFHTWETALYISGAAFPGLFAVFFGIQKIATGIYARGWTAEWIAGGTALAAALYVVGTVFMFNVVLDRSEGELRGIVVADKGASLLYPGGGRAWFAAPVPSPISFTFGGMESAAVDGNTYDSLKPGASIIEITAYHGALGFPWYGRKYYFSSAS